MNFDLSQFFSSWDTADSYAALAITLIGFLFGLLIGYLLRGPRIRKLRRELEDSNRQLVESRKEVGEMKDRLDKKEADLQKVNYDLVEVAGQIDSLEEAKSKLMKDVYEANQEVEKQQTVNRSYLANINDLNAQIAKFEEEWEQRGTTIETAAETPEDTVSHIPEEIIYHPQEDGQGLSETEIRLERFEAKLAQLESENQWLKSQVAGLHPATVPTPPTPPVSSSDLIFEIDDVPAEPELVTTSDKSVLHEKIIVGDLEKDDLTKIEGVGAGLQKKLNEIGIYTYAEIASWDAERAAQISRDIWIPGRVGKDDWVGQAKKLLQIKTKDPQAFETVVEKEQDLKVIEGVGPKIEKLLKDAGINSWHELAQTELERLQGILTDAGERYRIHDPTTWPDQALLAAHGKWEELEKLQNELKGGRKKKD